MSLLLLFSQPAIGQLLILPDTAVSTWGTDGITFTQQQDALVLTSAVSTWGTDGVTFSQGTVTTPTISTVGTPASDLIDGALRMIGVLRGCETANPCDANDALVRLNELIDQLSTQGLWFLTTTRSVYTLTTAGSYTIGPGGDFDQAWPETIERAGLISTTGSTVQERPLLVLTPADYANVSAKAATSPMPSWVYYDHSFNAGLGTVYVGPVPDGTTSGLQIAIYAGTTVVQYGTLATAYFLPPGYAKYLRYQLAVDLWPEYPEHPLPQHVVRTAEKLLADIKRANYRITDAVLDLRGLGYGGGGYDIWMG